MTIAKFPIIWNVPRTQSLAGNAFFTSAALTAYDDGHIEFVKDVDGKFYGECYLDPDVLGESPTITAVKFKGSLYANATTGIARINVGTKAIADAESFNPATLDNATAQDVSLPATAYLRKDITFTLTPTNFAEGDIVIIEIFHEGSHANDTLAVNTLLKTISFIEVTF